MCGEISGSRYVPSDVGTRDDTGVGSGDVGSVGVLGGETKTGSGEPVGPGEDIGLAVTAGEMVGPGEAVGRGNILCISRLPPRTARRQKATNTIPAPA